MAGGGSEGGGGMPGDCAAYRITCSHMSRARGLVFSSNYAQKFMSKRSEGK